MMSKRTMTIAYCEEMLPSFAVDVRIDDEGILINFSTVIRDVSFASTIRETQNVFKKVVFFCRKFWPFQILTNKIHDSTRVSMMFFTLNTFWAEIRQRFAWCVASCGGCWYLFNYFFIVSPGTAPVKSTLGVLIMVRVFYMMFVSVAYVQLFLFLLWTQ